MHFKTKVTLESVLLSGERESSPVAEPHGKHGSFEGKSNEACKTINSINLIFINNCVFPLLIFVVIGVKLDRTTMYNICSSFAGPNDGRCCCGCP